uniref:Uncharacterized protein n=1 Tax=Panagrellus redivivus TaxID=6233 RepID=A0A7E4VAY4_PANRE
MIKYVFVVTFHILRHIHSFDVAKEVDGGVQFINTGSVELVVPETLSFTVKRLHKSKLCIGDFIICYEPTSTIKHDEQAPYYNVKPPCPAGTCTLWIHPTGGYFIAATISDDIIYAKVEDEYDEVCPRKVINNRANFTILKLPDCPVIMNDAALPSVEAKKNTTLATVGIIAGCVVAVLLLLSIIIIVGYCFYK